MTVIRCDSYPAVFGFTRDVSWWPSQRTPHPPDFEEEYFDERDRKVRVRSEDPALNESAADAFAQVRASHREVFERSLPDADVDREAGFGWFATGPGAQPHP